MLRALSNVAGTTRASYTSPSSPHSSLSECATSLCFSLISASNRAGKTQEDSEREWRSI